MVSQGNSSGVKIAQVLFSIFDQRGIACQGKGPVVKIWSTPVSMIQMIRPLLPPSWPPSWEPIFSFEILSPRSPNMGHTWNYHLALAEFLLEDLYYPSQVDPPPERPDFLGPCLKLWSNQSRIATRRSLFLHSGWPASWEPRKWTKGPGDLHTPTSIFIYSSIFTTMTVGNE